MRSGWFEDATLDLASKFGSAVSRSVQLVAGDRSELTCRDVPEGTDRSGHPRTQPEGCHSQLCVTDLVVDDQIGDTEVQPEVIWETIWSKAASA